MTGSVRANIKVSSSNAKITDQVFQMNPDGTYEFSFEADDGSYRSEKKDTNGQVYGYYGFVDEDGKNRSVTYGSPIHQGQDPDLLDYLRVGLQEHEIVDKDVSET